MALRGLKILFMLLCSGASARAAGLIGFADGLTTGSAGGWACASGSQANVSVAAYAGSALLGIYPMTVNRPDVAQFCPGTQPHGFSFAFDPATQALFTGQTQLTLYAVAPGLPQVLLPSSNTQTSNPLPLPTGQLLGLTSPQEIAVTASTGGAAPTISLFAGGPTNEGLGTESAIAQPAPGGSYSLRLPVSGLTNSGSANALLPVFGAATNALGATAPLAAPLSLTMSGTTASAPVTVPVSVTVAQSGSYAGIRNNVYTTWLPANVAFAGLTGTVSLVGNNASFDEGLVELGYAPYDKADCLSENGRSVAGPPSLTRLWAGILKSNATGNVDIPVNFALPYAVANPSGGACLMTWVSAGYAYLSATTAQYATTLIALQAGFVPARGNAPVVTPFGMGGEFRFIGSAVPTSVYVGIMATKPIAVDGIAGTASVAPVTGTTVAPMWEPAPQHNWAVQTSFVYMPASTCAAANLHAQPTNGTFAVLRDGTPAAISIPSGAVPAMDIPIDSSGSQAVQRSAYASFPPGSANAGFSGTLQPGDCLVAYSTAAIEPTAVVDFENQSTVFLRPLQ
jgi:hypothetical protein